MSWSNEQAIVTSRVALVTGATRGIGLEICQALLRRGYCVIGVGRSVTEGQQNFELDATEKTLVFRRADVRSSHDVTTLFRWVGERFGKLDVLVNNAGIGTFLSVSATTDEVWQGTIATNLTGAFLCVRESLPLFRRNGGGLIVNMSSIAAARGIANLAAYSASKAGLLGLGRALAEELRPEKIHVCNILAGATATEFWETAGLAKSWSRAGMMPPEKVADLVAHVVDLYPQVVVEEVVLMPPIGLIHDQG